MNIYQRMSPPAKLKVAIGFAITSCVVALASTAMLVLLLEKIPLDEASSPVNRQNGASVEVTAVDSPDLSRAEIGIIAQSMAAVLATRLPGSSSRGGLWRGHANLRTTGWRSGGIHGREEFIRPRRYEGTRCRRQVEADAIGSLGVYHGTRSIPSCAAHARARTRCEQGRRILSGSISGRIRPRQRHARSDIAPRYQRLYFVDIAGKSLQCRTACRSECAGEGAQQLDLAGAAGQAFHSAARF